MTQLPLGVQFFSMMVLVIAGETVKQNFSDTGSHPVTSLDNSVNCPRMVLQTHPRNYSSRCQFKLPKAGKKLVLAGGDNGSAGQVLICLDLFADQYNVTTSDRVNMRNL